MAYPPSLVVTTPRPLSALLLPKLLFHSMSPLISYFIALTSDQDDPKGMTLPTTIVPPSGVSLMSTTTDCFCSKNIFSQIISGNLHAPLSHLYPQSTPTALQVGLPFEAVVQEPSSRMFSVTQVSCKMRSSSPFAPK